MEVIIQQWKEEALGIRSIYDTTLFHVEENTLYLITKYPGVFIGYHGNLVNKYEEILGMKVKMIELRYGITRF